MKKLIFVLSLTVMMLSSMCFAVTFSDVQGHWAEQYIMELTDKGIINGMGDGTFNPQGSIKYGEFFKLIMVASLPDEDWTQPNAKYNHWSSAYLEAAERYSIIEDGEIIEEIADQEITRGEVARYLGYCDIFIKGTPQESQDAQFYDVAELSDDDYTMLCHCVARGFITGYEDSTFKPDNTLTRAEVATILYRYLNK